MWWIVTLISILRVSVTVIVIVRAIAIVVQ